MSVGDDRAIWPHREPRIYGSRIFEGCFRGAEEKFLPGCLLARSGSPLPRRQAQHPRVGERSKRWTSLAILTGKEKVYGRQGCIFHAFHDSAIPGHEPRNDEHPNPRIRGSGCPRCPETSPGRADSVLVQDIPDTCLTTSRTDVSRHSRHGADAQPCRRHAWSSPPSWWRRERSPRSPRPTAFPGPGSMSSSPATETRARPRSNRALEHQEPHRPRPR